MYHSDERASAKEAREGNVSSSGRMQRSGRGRDKQGPHHEAMVGNLPGKDLPKLGFRSVFLKAGPGSGLVKKRGKAGGTGGGSHSQRLLQDGR